LVAAIVNERILPEHEAFVAAAATLQTTVAGLGASPSPATLAAAQEQWRATAEAWARVEPFQLRFSMLVSSEIKKWPINDLYIEELLANTAPIDAAALSMAGSTAKGLVTLEYLLFAPGPGTSASTGDSAGAAVLAALEASPRRLDYAAAVATDLARLSRDLLYLWSPSGDGHAQALIDASLSPNNMVAGSISMLTNEMIALLEGIVKTKLSYPLSGTDGLARPEAVESPYAGYSVPLIVANLATMQAVFQNDLAPYVTFLAGNDQLVAAIDAQFDRTLAALAAIPGPLEAAIVANPDAVATARDEVRNLLRLIKVDLANQLGITVTFSDSDGD
jgi:predicted lipoprotein